jgi:hypothetical protein
MSGPGRLLLIPRSAATQRPRRRPVVGVSAPLGRARAARANAITQVTHRDSRWRSVSGAILGDVVDRDYRPIIGRQLNPEIGAASQGSRPPRAAHDNLLTCHVRAHAQLKALPQRASDPGLTLLEARAIDNLSQRRRGGGPTAASRGAKGSPRRLQLGAGGLAPWGR